MMEEIESEALEATRSDCLTILAWANEYLEYCKSRFAKKTFAEKKAGFKLFVNHAGPEFAVEGVTPSLSLSFLSGQNEHRSGYSANKDRKNLSAAWDWGTKYIDSFPRKPNPFQAVDRFPETRKPRYVPPEQDFWAVFNLAEGQDKAMLATCLYLAARRGEMYRMKLSDIDWKNDQVRLWTRKRKNGTMEYDWLPMASELKRHLKEWIETRISLKTEDMQHVFVNANLAPCCERHYGKPFVMRQRFMERLCAKAKVKPFGFHSIRHLTASILYKNEYGVSVIQTILRHQNPNTTVRYIRSLGLDHVKKALEEGIRNNVIDLAEKKSAIDRRR
jgi:integrase